MCHNGRSFQRRTLLKFIDFPAISVPRRYTTSSDEDSTVPFLQSFFNEHSQAVFKSSPPKASLKKLLSVAYVFRHGIAAGHIYSAMRRQRLGQQNKWSTSSRLPLPFQTPATQLLMLTLPYNYSPPLRHCKSRGAEPEVLIDPKVLLCRAKRSAPSPRM